MSGLETKIDLNICLVCQKYMTWLSAVSLKHTWYQGEEALSKQGIHLLWQFYNFSDTFTGQKHPSIDFAVPFLGFFEASLDKMETELISCKKIC